MGAQKTLVVDIIGKIRWLQAFFKGGLQGRHLFRSVFGGAGLALGLDDQAFQPGRHTQCHLCAYRSIWLAFGFQRQADAFVIERFGRGFNLDIACKQGIHGFLGIRQGFFRQLALSQVLIHNARQVVHEEQQGGRTAAIGLSESPGGGSGVLSHG